MTQVSETSGLTAGIDIGTTSVKAVVADGDGTVLARARILHPVLANVDSEFVHDPDRAWRADVLDALAQVAPDRRLDAVSVSAMVPSLAAVTETGAAIGPGLLYGDRRGWSEDHDPDIPGDGDEVVAFLAWHAAQAPQAAGYWPAQAVANHALCGEGSIDVNTALSAWPLFDLEQWDRSVASTAGVDVAKLARVVPALEPVGRVPEGRPGAGALVGGGAIDAFAEQLVSGATEVGDVIVICGTTLITWSVAGGWPAAPGLWSVPHHLPERCLIGGPSNAGGLFIDMVTRWLGGEAGRAIDAMDALDPGDLPVWLPYVRGERTPLHRRDLRAAVFDLSHRHGPAHLLAAAYEASAFVVRHHLDLARQAGVEPRRIVATGGGTRAAPWMQALADVTGLPVAVSALPEGAALGAAFLARCSAGLEDDPSAASRWARCGATVEPRPRWVDPASERYERFRALTAEALARPVPSC